MKKVLIPLFLALITISAKASDEKIVPSKIQKVTVYSQGAQIFRESSYSIGKGVTEVIIEGISPHIDPKSLQVKATGKVIILDSKYSTFFPKPEKVPLHGLPLKIRQDILKLEDSIATINYAIQELQDEIDVHNATKKILANNGAIRGQGKVNDSIPLLKEAISYYTSKMMEINKELQKLNRKKNDQVHQRNGMNQRLIDLKNWQSSNMDNTPKGPIHRVIITLKASEYVKGDLAISYLVSNAGWRPIYDLRSEISTGKVNLNYKAQVYQNTGVEWEQVPLNISTNNPYLNKTKPTLHPWYVDYHLYRNSMNNRDVQSDLKQKSLSYGYVADDYKERSEEVKLAEAIRSDQFVELVDQVISAEFRIDLPYTIKSNGEEHMVLVKNVDLNATFNYYSVPKYDAAAYLVASITKLDELQLVPAKANIFFDGSYIGETYLDPTTMNDTLQLSLGKDPNIIVKRTLLKQECKDKIVGTKKERSFVYAIEVKNLKSKSIDLIIQDQIPVTQNADIEISAEELNKGKMNERTGIVEWKLSIKPKGKKDIKFGYKVKHNKDQHLPLL